MLNFLDDFRGIVKEPTSFLHGGDQLCKDIKDNLKKLYDFTKSHEENQEGDALKQLIIDGFDLEQVWQQIELQNDLHITSTLTNVSKLLSRKSKLYFEQPPENEESTSTHEENESQDEPEEELESDSHSEEPEDEPESKETFRKSVVDDDFFKLSEMENFLKNEESKLDQPNEESENSEDLDDEDEDSDDARQARYKDFFVAKKDDQKKRETPDSDEEYESSFNVRQKRLEKKIVEIEEEAIQDKSWQLKGEITADKRPQNSLLQEIVEFDLTSRPAPVITEETTYQLEDIIKQRIRDKVFDSVIRKIKPADTPLEFKKKLVLEQEKSKESLAQIYEKEFLEQQSALEGVEKEEKEPELHTEINKMIGDLFLKLDALSNFHFTPKPAVPELKIISHLPAISMEEVAPVAMSDAALLAPEEVKNKRKGELVGKGERTDSDKKRERRKKKQKQKIHAKKKNNENIKKKNNNNNNKVETTALKSSKAFFTQLEDDVKSQIKRKAPSKKEVNGVSAKKLKL